MGLSTIARNFAPAIWDVMLRLVLEVDLLLLYFKMWMAPFYVVLFTKIVRRRRPICPCWLGRKATADNKLKSSTLSVLRYIETHCKHTFTVGYVVRADAEATFEAGSLGKCLKFGWRNDICLTYWHATPAFVQRLHPGFFSSPVLLSIHRLTNKAHGLGIPPWNSTYICGAGHDSVHSQCVCDYAEFVAVLSVDLEEIALHRYYREGLVPWPY